MRRQRERLQDILRAIAEIEEYSSLGYDSYLNDKLIQGWIILQIQRIGEAASHLSSTVREQCSEIPWLEVISMRNFLVHEYFGIKPELVWMTVVDDLPLLKACVNRILETLDET